MSPTEEALIIARFQLQTFVEGYVPFGLKAETHAALLADTNPDVVGLATAIDHLVEQRVAVERARSKGDVTA